MKDLFISNLPKVGIVEADSPQCFMRLQANDVVGLTPQGPKDIWGRDGHRHDDPAWMSDAQGADGDADRGTGGNAVIDDNDGSVCQQRE